MKDKSRFSLIELIFVVVVLAGMSVVGIPKIISAVDNARIATDISSAQNISKEIQSSISKDSDLTSVMMTDVVFQETSTASGSIQVIVEDAAKNSQGVPVIKYGALRGTKFNVSVESGTGIIVKAGTTQIYPTPQGEWANKSK